MRSREAELANTTVFSQRRLARQLAEQTCACDGSSGVSPCVAFRRLEAYRSRWDASVGTPLSKTRCIHNAAIPIPVCKCPWLRRITGSLLQNQVALLAG